MRLSFALSPTRAVDAGLIDRFGSLDASDGGHTSRFAVAADCGRGAWGLTA